MPMRKNRNYNYFHITVQPKNCDGTNREINYLSKNLIEVLDKYLLNISNNYARVVENNSDKTGQHYHFVCFAKKADTCEHIKSNLIHIISNIYSLSDTAQERLVYVKHKTLKQAHLCAGGYLTKQYSGQRLVTNISSDVIEQYKKEYETLCVSKKSNEFSKWVLDYNKRSYPHVFNKINKYYEALSIIFEEDKKILDEFSSSNFQNFYLSILYKYKISYEYSDIKKFQRQILEYLVVLSKNTNIDNESLVNLMKFNKSDEYKIIEDENQYETNTILNYWSLK